jgi:mycofactocin glycosyltransferase
MMEGQGGIDRPVNPRSCVLIPYRNDARRLAQCLQSLLSDLPAEAWVFLVDDGSTDDQQALASFLSDRRVVRIRNETSLGPAVARNRGVAWCRDHGVSIVLLLDSDCIPGPGFVQTHLRLHEELPDIVCIGGAIRGRGLGFWARFDCVASWFTSLASSPRREVDRLLHVPTTNMSLKLTRLPFTGPLFDERLRTGEDVAFLHALMKKGGRAMFSPVPEIVHQDREDFRGFVRHQYRWAMHTYVVRFGQGHSPLFRLAFAAAFLALIPAYALFASVVSIRPWVRVAPSYLLWWPLLYLLYCVKGVGVIEGAIWPSHATYPDRPGI